MTPRPTPPRQEHDHGARTSARPRRARTTRRPLPVGLALLATLGLVLTGCTRDDPDATATSSADGRTLTTPLPDLPERPVDPAREHVDNAIAAYRNYVEVRDTVRQDHFRDWEDKVLPLTSADEADWVAWYFPQAVELGHYQVGADVVSNVVLAGEGYSEDPTGAGHERAVFEVCLDTSGRQELGSQGQDTSVPGSHGRFIATVTMQRQTMLDEQGAVMEDPYGQSWWRVAGEDYDRERPC